MKTIRIIQFAAVAATVVLLAGCKEEEQYSLHFSHALHVTENGMDCSDCHGAPGAFKPITHATCLDCHDEPQAEEISASTCGICHQEKQVAQYEAAAKKAEAETPEGEEAVAPEAEAKQPASGRHVFVHTEALAGKCADCHDYLLDENLQTVPKLSRSDVVSIRNKAHMSGLDCSTCHADMARNQMPPNHDQAWMKRHGVFASQDDAVCSVCHTEDTCNDCHSVMQPASHNNLWRLHTHGAVASWNRESCAVCHVEDSCTSCHATTRPQSHNARWSAPGKKPTHCIACHTEASAGEGCVVCHENGNSVLLHESFWPTGPDARPPHELLDNSVSCYECHWYNAPAGTVWN